MRDRRSVDDLSIEELEQILRIRKREQRMARLQRMEHVGRRQRDISLPETEPVSAPEGQEEAQPGISYESFIHSGRAGGTLKRKRRDRVLLAVELAAAGGLVAILVFAFVNLQRLNRESAQAQSDRVADLGGPLPTPLISTVVLPGGHTPPTASEAARPNYEEVPAHLRPLVEQQFAGPVVAPTASPSDALRIRIPAINVDAPIVQGDGWEQLQKGVGQHIGSSSPGQPGNLVLSAHNDIYGEIFRRLDALREGDEIIIETQRQTYTYRVLYWRVVSPTEVEVMDQTTEPITTLISCYPYLVNSDRIVVIAELEE
jgi:sortase A